MPVNADVSTTKYIIKCYGAVPPNKNGGWIIHNTPINDITIINKLNQEKTLYYLFKYIVLFYSIDNLRRMSLLALC